MVESASFEAYNSLEGICVSTEMQSVRFDEIVKLNFT